MLDDREHLRCPMLDGGGVNARDGRLCVWPGPIEIDADANGAKFAQNSRFWHRPSRRCRAIGPWPQDVAVDGRVAAVWCAMAGPICDSRRRLIGSPAASPGRGSGSHGATDRQPGSPAVTACASRCPTHGRQPAAGCDARSDAGRPVGRAGLPQAHRPIPGLLTTRLALNVAGRPRETLLGPLLPAGFVPMQLAGPCRRVCNLTGSYVFRCVREPGHSTSRPAAPPPSTRARPHSGVAEEVWSFEPMTGCGPRPSRSPASILAGQCPERLGTSARLSSLGRWRIAVTERSRGPGGGDRNQMPWSASSGGTSTARATPSWTRRRTDATGLAARDGSPTDCRGRARTENRCSSLRARTTGESSADARLDLEATADRAARRFPGLGLDDAACRSGDDAPFPPGHRLLAARSVSTARVGWLNRWRLLDIFAVLLVAAVALRVAGLSAALLSLVAFTLTHHELPALTWAALNLLVASRWCARCPIGCACGLASGAQSARAIVVLFLVPFALSQARLAFFPQLGPGRPGRRTDHRHEFAEGGHPQPQRKWSLSRIPRPAAGERRAGHRGRAVSLPRRPASSANAS